ncbi:MAG: hypothetical protein ABSH08_09195 [Tepidisphaeraceae bacterium]|jgi:hypothetical protein
MRSIPSLESAIAFVLVASLSGCVTGTWDVTDDPALPNTGWIKGQIYVLQRSALIYKPDPIADFCLKFPEFWDKRVVPKSMDEFRKRRKEFSEDIVGVLEGGSQVRLKAILLDKNPENGDDLCPVGQVTNGEFRGKAVDLTFVSKFDNSSGDIEYRTIGKSSAASIWRRDPKVFIPVVPAQ